MQELAQSQRNSLIPSWLLHPDNNRESFSRQNVLVDVLFRQKIILSNDVNPTQKTPCDRYFICCAGWLALQRLKDYSAA